MGLQENYTGALMLAVMLAGCGSVDPILSVPSRVDVSPSVPAVRIPAPVFTQDFRVPLLLPASGWFRGDESVPALAVAGSVSDICSALAVALDLNYLIFPDGGGDDGIDAGVSLGGDNDFRTDDDVRPDAVGFDIALQFQGGNWSGLVDALALYGVGVDRRGSWLVCGESARSWRLVRRPNLAPDVVVALGEGVEVISLGSAWLWVDGDVLAVRRFLSALDAVSAVPAWGDIGVEVLSSNFDLELLGAWLSQAGLGDVVELVGSAVVAPAYALSAVREYVRVRGSTDCVNLNWSVRRVRGVDALLSALDALVGVESWCSSPHYYSDSGLLLLRSRGARVGDVLAGLEYLDPAARPVVVRVEAVSASESDRESLGAIFGDLSGSFRAESITGGVLIGADIGDVGAAISGVLAASRGSSVQSLALPGVVGERMSIRSGREVPVDGGAIVGDSGQIRQVVERVRLGVELDVLLLPAVGGWSVEFDVSVRGPGDSADAFTDFSRAGVVYLPAGWSVLLALVDDSSAGETSSVLNWSSTSSVSTLAVWLGVQDGVLRLDSAP